MITGAGRGMGSEALQSGHENKTARLWAGVVTWVMQMRGGI